MRILGTTFFFALLVIASCPGGAAQAAPATGTFTLQQAVSLALNESPGHRLAALDVQAAVVNQRLAKSALLPTLSFSELASRGNDPVFVFGARLRQQRFSQNDFALNALNRPTPLSNVATRFSGDWVAFDSWKTEFAVRAAAQRAGAIRSAATRADQEILHRVVVGYLGVLIAGRQLDVARHQVDTAQAMVESSQSRVAAGLAVDSDLLSAQANLAERQQEEISTEGGLEIAWAELERAEGAPIPEESRQITGLQPSQLQPLPLSESVHVAIQARPDRQSLEHAAEASHSEMLSARSAFAPTLRAFGNWEQDRGSFSGAGGNNWMAGVALSIDLLPAAKRQQLALARIAEERSRVDTQSADQQIRLEVTQAWFAQQSASRMVQVADAARTQTAESLRILHNRYTAGLATITDLLRGEDAGRQAEAGYWAAVSRSRIAWCDLRFAMGTLNADNLGDFE